MWCSSQAAQQAPRVAAPPAAPTTTATGCLSSTLLLLPVLQLQRLHSLLQLQRMQQQELCMLAAAIWQLAGCSLAVQALLRACRSATACALIAM
jgi:hypothetical protein